MIALSNKGGETKCKMRMQIPASGTGVIGAMGMPRKPAIEITPDGRVYYVDHRNARWRVHDVAFGPPHARPHQRRRLAPGDGRAGYRYFVGESGEQRSYRFTADDSRDVTVEVLDPQLRRAEFPARGRFDGAKHYTP